jgi:hypothetical protein
MGATAPKPASDTPASPVHAVSSSGGARTPGVAAEVASGTPSKPQAEAAPVSPATHPIPVDPVTPRTPLWQADRGVDTPLPPKTAPATPLARVTPHADATPAVGLFSPLSPRVPSPSTVPVAVATPRGGSFAGPSGVAVPGVARGGPGVTASQAMSPALAPATAVVASTPAVVTVYARRIDKSLKYHATNVCPKGHLTLALAKPFSLAEVESTGMQPCGHCY